MTYGILGVGAIGAAIVTGLCEGVLDAGCWMPSLLD